MKNEQDKYWPRFNIENAKIVILGTYPGPDSLDQHKFYANKKNRFWDLLGIAFGDFNQLEKYGIGLWDVIKKCVRDGSSDKNIKNISYNDLAELNGKTIYFNGKKAYKYYKKAVNSKKCKPLDKSTLITLPSSSCANTRSNNREELWNNVIKHRSKS